MRDLHACVQVLFTIKLPERRSKINKPPNKVLGRLANMHSCGITV
jgi:hypothetical protein